MSDEKAAQLVSKIAELDTIYKNADFITSTRPLTRPDPRMIGAKQLA
jgi:phosphoglycerate dehydrogenase-like enzyme